MREMMPVMGIFLGAGDRVCEVEAFGRSSESRFRKFTAGSRCPERRFLSGHGSNFVNIVSSIGSLFSNDNLHQFYLKIFKQMFLAHTLLIYFE